MFTDLRPVFKAQTSRLIFENNISPVQEFSVVLSNFCKACAHLCWYSNGEARTRKLVCSCARARERESDMLGLTSILFKYITRLISEPLLASLSFGPFSRPHPFSDRNGAKKLQVCTKVCYQIKFGFIRNYPFSFCPGGRLGKGEVFQKTVRQTKWRLLSQYFKKLSN